MSVHEIDLDRAGRELFAVMAAQRAVLEPPLAEKEALVEEAARREWPKMPESSKESFRQLAAQIVDAALVP